jgi:hypothetical protein
MDRTIDEFFAELFAQLQYPWLNHREGTLSIVSRVCSGVPCTYAYLDTTIKSLSVTFESLENQEFRLSLNEIRVYPEVDMSRVDYLSTNGTNVLYCIKALLVSTWKATGHGRLTIKSKKHRNGKIKVLVGDTISYQFFLDPRELSFS